MDDLQTPNVSRPWWALVVAVLAALLTGWFIVSAGPTPAERDEAAAMVQVAPGGEVELASLSHEHRTVYEAAAADEEAFEAVRCYCGCESFLDHASLLDCFVRPAGGWERHATGCAVCIAEAEEVLEGRADGVPLDEIVDGIDDRYGAITVPTV